MSGETREAPQAVACTLGSAELGTQVERWRRLYADAGTARDATDEGLRVRFRREAVVERELEALVAVERACCTWAEWTVEAGDRELVLGIASDGDGVAVIHGWFLDEEPAVPSAG